MTTSLQAIANKAEKEKKHRFRNLYGLLSQERIEETYKRMNRRSAPGLDKVTVKSYGVNLSDNIADLVARLKDGRYRSHRVKRVYIPKPNGKLRPLGIPVVEDRILQATAKQILEAIYESDFLKESYGYRPGKGAIVAVKDLTEALRRGGYRYVVEADIKGFFDGIDHDWLIRMLEERVNDRRFLQLIRKWLKAGILEPEGMTIHPGTGTPQGGVISPILANIYLHYALDLWFERVVKPRLACEATFIRYADDFVMLFENEKDATRFYSVLGKRLGRFGLELAPEKTRILRFDHSDLKDCQSFEFLGFEFYKIQKSLTFRMTVRRTSPKKQRATLLSFKLWLKENRHERLWHLVKALNRKLRGYYNYFGLKGNSKSLTSFFYYIKGYLFKILNRRSQKWSYKWQAFENMLRVFKILQPYILEGKS